MNTYTHGLCIKSPHFDGARISDCQNDVIYKENTSISFKSKNLKKYWLIYL